MADGASGSASPAEHNTWDGRYFMFYGSLALSWTLEDNGRIILPGNADSPTVPIPRT